MEQMFAAVGVFNDEVHQAGAWVYANGLMPAETATVVDARSGETVLTDGPYLEAKEHIGGFWIIDVADLDAALTWAAKGSVACHGPRRSAPLPVGRTSTHRARPRPRCPSPSTSPASAAPRRQHHPDGDEPVVSK